jgi:MmgE/PrpD N-terminal domain
MNKPNALGLDALVELALQSPGQEGEGEGRDEGMGEGGAWHETLALHLADTVLAALVGKPLAEAQKIRTIRGVRGEDALDLASLAASIRMTEIDDIHRLSGVTVSAIVVPAALSAFERVGFTRLALLDALKVAYQCTLRLALAMGGAHLMTKGLWPSYLVATFGSAVTLGRLHGLNPIQMKNAMALALAQTPRGVGKSQGDYPGRWFLFGQALERGEGCVQAALHGIEADHDLLSDEWLKGVGGERARMDALQEHVSLDSISFKPYCAAKQTLCAIEGMQILLKEGLDARQIEHLEVEVPKAYAGMIDREPYHVSRLASMVSVKWQLALTALRPQGLCDVVRAPLTNALLDTQGLGDVEGLDSQEAMELERFMEKIEVKVQTKGACPYPQEWPCTLKAVQNGRTWQAQVTSSPGDPEQGVWSPAHVLDKAIRFGLAGEALGAVKQMMILDGGEAEFQEQMKRLTQLLR